MNELFLKIVNMSLSASWLVLAVLALRFLLKKAPRWASVLLWGIVAIRLVCPFTFESRLSLIPSAEVFPEKIISGPSFDVQTGVAPVDDRINEYLGSHYFEGVTAPANNGLHVVTALAAVWAAGMAALVLYAAFSYLRLRRKLNTAVRCRGNIYQSENVGSPFVLGLIRPKIYVPFQLGGQALEHVIAHEQAHIRRRDHWWKPVGFLLLAVHWFNPLMWLAYGLLCRDIELACDEKVIKGLGSEQRAGYTQALVACSVRRHMAAACPLAFGEVGVKQRVKSIMNYKRPAFWLVVLSLVSCMAVAVCFLTDPKRDSFRLKIVVPAGSQAPFVYTNEEVSPLGRRITVRAGQGLGDTEVVLRPAGAPAQNACGPKYLTPGMPVTLDAEKGGWFKIGVNVQNDTGEDKIVYVDVDNVEVRIAEPADGAAETTYTYEKDGFHGEFQITLYGDGSFAYSEGPASSHYGFGHWEQNGELVTLRDDANTGAARVNHFRLAENALVFIEKGSSNFPHIKLADGEQFLPAGGAPLPSQPLPQAETPLEAAVSRAILKHFAAEVPDGLFHVESHVLLASETASGTPKAGEGAHLTMETAYLLALHETYSTYGGRLEAVGGSYGPVALTFAVDQNGEYSPADYWEPRDAGYYAQDIREKFPEKAAEQALNGQAYAEELQRQNYGKVLELLSRNGGLEHQITGLLGTIQSSPAAASGVKDYIAAHEQEYQELIGYGEYTLRYCFAEFLQGGQTGLRGQIMRAALDEIAPEAQLKLYAENGQEYFNAWKNAALELSKQHDIGWLEKHQPAVYLLLQMLGAQ